MAGLAEVNKAYGHRAIGKLKCMVDLYFTKIVNDGNMLYYAIWTERKNAEMVDTVEVVYRKKIH